MTSKSKQLAAMILILLTLALLGGFWKVIQVNDGLGYDGVFTSIRPR
jgi:hypothetical protein